MRFRLQPLDFTLLALSGVSLAGALLANEDAHFRLAVCSTIPCPAWAAPTALLKFMYDISVASIVSLIFYGLLVRLPEHQKRKRIKDSFRRQYVDFKKDCVGVMLGVVDGTYSIDLRDELVDQKSFKSYFEQSFSRGQDKWDALHNRMDEYHLRQLLTNLEILRDEMRFVLASVDIANPKPFEFLKRSSAIIVKMRNTTLDYDSMKGFGNFLWEVFAGWSFITGYREGDVVEEMIEQI